jgi:DNA processing protein
MMQERDYYLAFSLVNGIGPKTFKSLLNYFKTAEKAWNSTSKELKKAGFSERLIQKFEKQKGKLNINSYLEKLKQKKASFIALCDKEYPKLLSQIENPPIVLFIKVFWQDRDKVDLNDYQMAVGIVGTRKITNYGREVTKIFSYNLAQSGFTIVSGLAIGVDAVAAESAIQAGGKTIAVMGSGVDICVPSSNESLYDKIIDNKGIIVSEFPLGFSPTKGSFPSRNRIIAGLSMGVLVTEGASDSGSLITANYGLEFGRKVFAIPGPITSSLSAAPLKLIEKGAKLAITPEDILKEFKIQNAKSKIASYKSKVLNLSKDELKIIQMLENEPLHFDELVRLTKISSAKLGTILSIMEVEDIVKSFEGGMFALTNGK